MKKSELENLSSKELIDLIIGTEAKFADSNAYAAQLVIELENKNDELIKSQNHIMHTEKLASIGQLAAGVGHEINNPLAIVVGNISILKKELKKLNIESDVINKTLERQESALDRIKNIVLSLRTYARVDTETIETINFHQVIEDTLKLIGNVYQNEGIAIELILNALDSNVLGNLGRTQQVLMNFISNARDALENCPQKKITIKTTSNDKQLKLQITDTGCGIDDKNKTKIFDSFFTTKPIGKGTGLGLSISAAIIKEMNGLINLESQTNKGTTFSIDFPLTKKQGSSQLNSNESDLIEFTGTALIVDDEPDLRDILKDILSGFGLQVIESENGLDALEKVKNKKFDFVFSDLKMPKMSGVDFIKKAKALSESNKNCKYILITGGDSDPELEKISDGFIPKPFSPELIHQTILKVRSKTN